MTEEMQKLNDYRRIMDINEGTGFAVEGDTIYLTVDKRDTDTADTFKALCKGGFKEKENEFWFELGKTELKFTSISVYMLYNVSGEEFIYSFADYQESVRDIYEFMRDNPAYMTCVENDKIIVRRKDA